MSLLLAAALAPAMNPSTAAARYIRVDLIASTLTPKPGSTVFVGFRMTPEAGWHGYWSNPGESGLAPKVDWTSPPLVRFGPLLHPAPTLLQSMGVVSYVHSGVHVLVSRMIVSRNIRSGTPIPVTANLRWAACSANQCVPQHATLSLEMIAGDGAPSAGAKALKQAMAALPVDGPRATFSTSRGKLLLQLPRELHLDPRAVRFFPDRNGFYDASEAHAGGGRPTTIESPLEGSPPDRVTGVLTDGSTAYQMTFDRAPIAAAEDRAPPLPQAQGTPEQVQHTPAQAPPKARETAEGQPAQPPESAPTDRILRALALLGILGFALSAFALARRPYR